MTSITVHDVNQITHEVSKVRNNPNCHDYDWHEISIKGGSAKAFTVLHIFTEPNTFPDKLINQLPSSDKRDIHTVAVNGFDVDVILDDYTPAHPSVGMDGPWEDSSPAEDEVIDFTPASGNALLDAYIEDDIDSHESIREQIRDSLLDTDRDY